MYKIKTEDVYEDISSNKEMFDFSNYSTKLKYYDDSNKLVMGKMENEIRDVVIKEFVGLKPMIYLFLVGNNSAQNKVKGMNKNVVASINHHKHKYVLLDNKCFRHSMNSIQSKDHRIGTKCVIYIQKYLFKTMNIMD